jgi:tetratricopeptide (TPR) repeat protein
VRPVAVRAAFAGLVVAVAAFAAGRSARPDEPPAPSPPPKEPLRTDEIARRVEAAVAAKDDAALAALAASRDVDSLLVADELCGTGSFVAAEAYARASASHEVEALSAYVAEQRAHPTPPERRRLAQALEADLDAGRFETLVPRSEGFVAEDDVTSIRVLFARGRGFWERKDYAACLDLLDRMIAIARRLRWPRREAFLLERSAVALEKSGDLDGALARLKEEEALAGRRSSRRGIARARWLQGGLLERRGDRPAAVSTYRRAADDARDGDDRALEGGICVDLTLALQKSGDLKGAVLAATRGAEASEAAGLPGATARVLVMASSAASGSGDLGKALDFADRALRAAEAAKRPDLVAHARGRRGSVLLGMGETARALEDAEAAVAGPQIRDDAVEYGGRLQVAAEVRREMEQGERAVPLFEKAIGIFRAASSWEMLSICLEGLANAQGDLGRAEDGLATLDQALEAAQSSGLPWRRAQVLLTKAIMTDRAGDSAAAETLAQQAVEGFASSSDRRLPAYAEGFLGYLRVHRGDAAGGIPLLEKVDRVGERLRDTNLRLNALSSLSVARLESGDPARALEDAKRVLGLLQIRSAGLSDEAAAAVRSQESVVFSAGATAALRTGDVPEVVRFLESGRAWALLQSLDRRDSIRRAAVPKPLFDAEHDAQVGVSRAHAGYAAAVDAGDVAAIRVAGRALDEAEDRIRAVRESIQREARRIAGVLDPKPAPVEEIEEALGADEAVVLLSFLAPIRQPDAAHPAFAVVVTKGSARLVLLPKARALPGDLGDPAGRGGEGAIEAMKDAIAAPLALGAGIRRVIVSADGTASFAPFPALWPDREVVVVPSATTYLFLREESRERGAKILAVGDPDYAARGAAIRGSRRLPPLPASREEARAVGDVALLGADATVANLWKAIRAERRWRAVHFACHALVDAEGRGGRAALALTATEGGDGLLTAGDVFDASVPADLVVLSACDTSRGRVVGGEGVLGLVRAFMYSGAPRVLASLWKVDDAATHALMTKFYETWNPRAGAPGKDAAEALRLAQEHVRSQEKWRHPRFWAAWVLWGLPD